MSFLGTLLGYIMWVCYLVIPVYGIALLLFTLLTRLIMLPFTIKQQKSMGKMALVQPQIQEIQKKYANNKEKLNEEMMKIYQKEGYNPMSGCLPLLIQFPILFGLIDVIYKPLKHILHLPENVITIGEQIATRTAADNANAIRAIQLSVVNGVKENPSLYAEMGADAIEKIQGINLNFLWMDLTLVPEMNMFFQNFNPIVFIPILAALSSLALSLMTTRNNTSGQAANAGSMKMMMYMMPLMSGWFAFQVPAGVGLYWIYSSLIGIAQHYVVNKIYNPKEMAEKAQKELEERKAAERQERIEAKKAAKEKGIEEEKALSAKEINRRKLAEARKRDAEKYGEEYVEVTDADLN